MLTLIKNIVRISKGNMKLGTKIPNINLSPPKSCAKMPCLNTGCYAMKAYRQYPNVKESWDFNYNLFRENPEAYFDMIIDKLSRKKSSNRKYVRWHSAGEIINQEYVDGMFRVARAIPKTRFLCFTKKYGLNYSDRPENLAIIFSTWPNLYPPKRLIETHPIAWMNDHSEKTETKIKEESKNAMNCPGSCETCKACWHIHENKHDVIFAKH